MEGAERICAELVSALEAAASAADSGTRRARRSPDPVLRGRWLAIAAARVEHRERLVARLGALGVRITAGGKGGEPAGDVATLLRSDLATSHALSARYRRISRLAAALRDAETAALCERLAAEALGHAAELARSLALLYAREVRTVAH